MRRKKKKKKKIWADEYINLATLLDMNRQDDISVTRKKSAGQPTISLSNPSKKEIVSIDQWTRAFLIFSAVYAEKKPIEAGSLFKYISLIRDIWPSSVNIGNFMTSSFAC